MLILHSHPQLGLDVKTKSTEDSTEVVEITEEPMDEDQQIQTELERLNAEASARAKRERRKANEVKTKTIQRMQLSMTAPLDIGLEQQDAALMMDEDMFDLGEAEKGLKRRGGAQKFASRDKEEDDSGDEEEGEGEESEEEVLDSDEERERKTKGLEDELDGMYDSYRQRLAERDSKFKVKEARKKNKEREEWHGIKEDKSGSSDEDDEDGEEGGWEVMQQAKGRNDDSSDDDSESEIGETPSAGQKRRRAGETKAAGKITKKARFADDKVADKAVPASSRQADLWFSQDVFGDVGEIPDSEEESGLEDEEDEDEVDDAEEADEVSRCFIQQANLSDVFNDSHHRVRTATTTSRSSLKNPTTRICGMLKTKMKMKSSRPIFSVCATRPTHLLCISLINVYFG